VARAACVLPLVENCGSWPLQARAVLAVVAAHVELVLHVVSCMWRGLLWGP